MRPQWSQHDRNLGYLLPVPCLPDPGDPRVPRRPLRTALAALVPVLALVSACQPLVVPSIPVAASSATTTAPLSQRAQLLVAINRSRTDAGLAPLGLRDEVATVARRWAAQMARDGRLAHRPRLREALVAEGVHPRYWAENVGVGAHVREVHEAFMRSAPHRANVLDARFTEVGIGTVAAGGRVWVVVDFTG